MKRRTQKLVRTGLQLRLTLWFVGITALTLLFQFAFLTSKIDAATEGVTSGAARALARDFQAHLLQGFLTSLGISLSVTLVTGVLLTHRIVGPLQRITRHLEKLTRGEKPDECRIRKTDELQEFAAVLNGLTAALDERGHFEEAHGTDAIGSAESERSRAA